MRKVIAARIVRFHSILNVSDFVPSIHVTP